MAAKIVFRGCNFILSLVPVKFSSDGAADLLYRRSEMNFLLPNRGGKTLLSHQIIVEWPGNPQT
jgi:hypothetical protein